MNIVKAYWREWNPARLRRLLLLKDQQIANNANGWANTFRELTEANARIKELEAKLIGKNDGD